jgi:hypothetical protein
MEQAPIEKKGKQYDKSNLKDAMESVRNKTLTTYSASKKFGVPKTTLTYNLTKKVDKKMGAKTVLSAETEDYLAEWVVDKALIGKPRTHADLLNVAVYYDKVENNPAKFGKNGPSATWLQGFKSRHPEIMDSFDTSRRCRTFLVAANDQHTAANQQGPSTSSSSSAPPRNEQLDVGAVIGEMRKLNQKLMAKFKQNESLYINTLIIQQQLDYLQARPRPQRDNETSNLQPSSWPAPKLNMKMEMDDA